MVPRYGCKVSPSRIRNAPPLGTDVSCALAGPRIPIDVLFTLSSLSCCNVSRSACKPCVINSSSEPTTPRQSTFLGQDASTYNPQNFHNASQDTFSHSGFAPRSTWQNTRTSSRTGRTRTDGAPIGPAQRQGSRLRMGACRIPAC
jgi:hypothetical protein